MLNSEKPEFEDMQRDTEKKSCDAEPGLFECNYNKNISKQKETHCEPQTKHFYYIKMEILFQKQRGRKKNIIFSPYHHNNNY